MVINVQEMPRAGADVEGDYRCTTVGGCSFNVADVLYKLDLPFESYMPVGEGQFADLVAKALGERGYPVYRESGEGDNGWCLSLADASGERTFISMFGLERRMKPDWFERFDIESFDYFYVSGYQAEGENGRVILEALSKKRPDAVVLFDPGPRVHFMPRERIDDFCRLGCLFTVNADEALFMTGTTRVEDAALRLHDMSGREARRDRRRPRRDRGRRLERAPHSGLSRRHRRHDRLGRRPHGRRDRRPHVRPAPSTNACFSPTAWPLS